MKAEEEARQCWCPFANVYVPYQSTGAAGNRALNDSDTVQGRKRDALCIASSCMAWRWSYRFEHVETGEGTHHDPKRGFCGLAGKP